MYGWTALLLAEDIANGVTIKNGKVAIQPNGVVLK
jgi:hypothetical protein